MKGESIPEMVRKLSEAMLPQANKTQVFDLMDELRRTFEKHVNEKAAEGQEVGYMDAFMGAHNFHKLIVQDIADRAGFTGEARKMFFQMAADTFQQAVNVLKDKVR